MMPARASEGGRIGDSVSLAGEAIDDALERHDLEAVRGYVAACDPSAHDDEDVGLTVLILTVCAREPLRAEREALAVRVRADLSRRGWALENIAGALDGVCP